MRFDWISTTSLVALAAAISLLGGCAVSNSVDSVSDSVSSPFGWSSSSSGGDDSAMYRQDVERLTLAHIQSEGDASTLRRSLAGLAQAEGITDWASDAPTLLGFRDGLRAAGLDAKAQDAYAERLLGRQSNELLRLAEHPAR